MNEKAAARARAAAQAMEQRLDTGVRSPQGQRFELMLRERVMGQGDAIDAILDSFSKVLAGIRNPERPILNLLFLGPTGVGKTETVKALAETVFGKRDAFVRINCQEFSNDATVAKLFGSPPGYVGNDIEPLLSQANLDRHHEDAQRERRGVFADGEGRIAQLFPHADEHYLSIVCFDEIEKAHPTVWNALLGLMEDGHLTLGNNERVDFTRAIIVMTTNVGAESMSDTLRHKSIGFHLGADIEAVNQDLRKQAIEAAKDVFPYEFFNRFDDVICFRALTRADLKSILDRMISEVYNRLLAAGMPIILHYTSGFVDLLLREGYNPEFGARPLRRAVERHLVSHLSRLIASNQIHPGQVIAVRVRRGRPEFLLEGRDDGTKLVV